MGDTITVEAFEVGQKVKISGKSKGKGFQGTIKRHNFSAGPKSHGSHNVRAPGSIGASATPSRVFKGIRGPGRMGGGRVTQRGLDHRRADRRPEPDARPRRRAGPQGRDRGGAHRWLMRRSSAAPKKLTLDDAVFGAPFNGPLVHETVIAELAARRQGTHSTRTRGMVRGGGAKPWRQKGTGRARQGTIRAPQWTGGGVVFGPSPRHYTVKVNRKARQAALRSALSLHAERGSLFGLDAGGFDAPSTKQAAGLLEDRRGGSVLLLLGSEEAAVAKSFRNLSRVNVLPAEAAGVADIVGAATLVASQDGDRRADRRAARGAPQRPRRRAPDGRQPGHHPPRRLREVLRPRDGGPLHLPRPRRRAQDPDQAGRRAAVRRQRGRGPHR